MTDHISLEAQLRAAAEARRHEMRATSEGAPTDDRPAGMGARAISPGDGEWVEGLCNMEELGAPSRLFVEGLPLRTDAPTVAVVGTRRPTAAGIEATQELTRGLVEAGVSIVSGLAMGIDAVAHRTCLEAGGYTIAVLGTGLDVNYPARNRSLKEQIRVRGTLVTEYDQGTQAHAFHFPDRNRIVAGLAHGVLVIEGGVKSGALITARLGVDAGKKVWAVPGSIRNPMATGPNELIRASQATLVTHVKHIFEELAPFLVWEGGTRSRPLAPAALSDEEREVIHVMDDVPLSPDRIIRLTELSVGEVAMAVSRLEVKGFVNRRPAGYEISRSGTRVRAALMSESRSPMECL